MATHALSFNETQRRMINLGIALFIGNSNFYKWYTLITEDDVSYNFLNIKEIYNKLIIK